MFDQGLDGGSTDRVINDARSHHKFKQCVKVMCEHIPLSCYREKSLVMSDERDIHLFCQYEARHIADRNSTSTVQDLGESPHAIGREFLECCTFILQVLPRQLSEEFFGAHEIWDVKRAQSEGGVNKTARAQIDPDVGVNDQALQRVNRHALLRSREPSPGSNQGARLHAFP